MTGSVPASIPVPVPAQVPPLYGARVSAGRPFATDDHVEGALDLNTHLVRRPAATFFVRASGESMRDAGIFDGDLLVVDRAIAPRAGDIVIACVRGELTVKRLRRAGAAWALAPENPAAAEIALDDDGCEIWGVVAHSVRHHCAR